MKKILAMLLVAAMVFGLAACAESGSKDTTGSNAGTVTYVDPYASLRGEDSYDELSQAIYDDILGEFYEAYEAAKEADNVSQRYALMAIAEAKLMEAAVMLPNYSNGGNYAISRVAPYTAPNALWGNDSYRYHNVVVATEPITAAHREEMKAKWAELKGTGTYEAWAKQYLTDKGYTLKDSYTFGYSSDPETWDVLSTAQAVDCEAIINTYDGLYEYDCEGTLQPALATGYTMTENADGTVTFTFTLRQGVKWVDSQGREVGEVTADDFVAGMQHMLDCNDDLAYLAYEAAQISGSYDYYAGTITDFTQVGVKAVDTYTVAYTLDAPCSFFTTMLGYGVFAPMNRAYYESKGGKFGADFDAAAESYTYGKTPDDIAYCGPYLVSSYTASNTLAFSANPNYWNKDNITIKTITWKFNDGSDVLKAYNDCMSGVIDGAGLNSSAVKQAQTDGKFDTLAYISSCDATTFFSFYNLNREATANYNDATVGATSKTEEDMNRSQAAMYNVHFRRAISFAVDRGAYNAQSVGEDLKLTSLRNCFTPGNFVYLEEDVTVKINGADKTYAAGTYYGQIMQDPIDADGVKMTVWDPEAEAGVGSSDGYDGWYNVDNAKEELNTAIAELKAEGIEISAENPIYLDYPYYSASETNTNMANAYKQSIESALGGAVIVNLVDCVDIYGAYYAGYFISVGSEANYDVYSYAGWGPDYGDPQTYLDTILPQYTGYMTMMLGLF